jgi:hypothetical protein
VRFSPLALWFATPDFAYHGGNDEGAAMTVRHLRLALGLFFLVAGVGLLVLRLGFPDVAAKVNDPTRLLIGALLALALAGVNLAKWYSGLLWFRQRATPVRRPLQPDSTSSGEEYNPELDFDKQGKP